MASLLFVEIPAVIRYLVVYPFRILGMNGPRVNMATAVLYELDTGHDA